MGVLSVLFEIFLILQLYIKECMLARKGNYQSALGSGRVKREGVFKGCLEMAESFLQFSYVGREYFSV